VTRFIILPPLYLCNWQSYSLHISYTDWYREYEWYTTPKRDMFRVTWPL